MTQTSELQSQTEQPGAAAPGKKSSRKPILALSVFALGLNAAAVAYTSSPSDFALPFALPNISSLAELLPHERATAPIPDPIVAALKDVQSAQQQYAAALQDRGSLLQQNTALLQQDAAKLDTLRLSITDEQVDVKKISAQLSTLIAKVDSLQNAVAAETTSSILQTHSLTRLSRKRISRVSKRGGHSGPISVGGAPLIPALRQDGALINPVGTIDLPRGGG